MNKVLLLVVALALDGCARQDSSQESKGSSSDQSAVSTQAAVPAQQASGEVRVAPSEPRMGTPVEVVFKLKGRRGELIADADVQAIFIMEMGNMTMREPIGMKWNGSEYVGRYAPTMAGEWEVEVEARRNGQLLLSMPSTIQVQK